MLEVHPRGAPRRGRQHQLSEVLREYREYERSVTTLVDAAVKPKVGAYVTNIRTRLDEIAPGVPFYVMKSNGGVLSAGEVVHQPITTMLSGPAAGALGAALIAGTAGFDRVLTCDGGGTSTDVTVVIDGEPALTTEGSVGDYPSQDPDDRRRHRRRGRRLDRLALPRGHAQGRARKSAGADPGPMCYPDGGDQPTVTDAHVVLGRIPPHLLGGEIPLSVEAAFDGLAALGAKLDLYLERTATGILEISAWNQANALRQVTVAKGLDVRDFTLTTFGGSGSLLACRLMDILNLPRTLVPPNPGNVSAFGLLTVDVRNDYVQTVVAKHADLDLDPRAGGVRRPRGPGAGPRWTARASAATSSACSGRRTCATSARRSRCACRCADGELDADGRRGRRPGLPRRAPPALRLRLRRPIRARPSSG